MIVNIFIMMKFFNDIITILKHPFINNIIAIDVKVNFHSIKIRFQRSWSISFIDFKLKHFFTINLLKIIKSKFK
jgi:hypothetical protein